MKIDLYEIQSQLWDEYLQKTQEVMVQYFEGEIITGYFGWFEEDKHCEGTRIVKVEEVNFQTDEMSFTGDDGISYYPYPDVLLEVHGL